MPEVANSNVVIRNIAIATDFCPWSDRATQHALFVARRFGAVVHFLHSVCRSEFSFVPDLMVSVDELAERDSQDLISRLNAAHCLENIEHYCWNLSGEVPDVFGDFVKDHNIDLLVMGTRGRTGLPRFLFGSVSERIMHTMPCPVLAIGPCSRNAATNLEVKRMLFACDLSAKSSAAIPYIVTAAKTWTAEIDLLRLNTAASSSSQQLTELFRRTNPPPEAHNYCGPSQIQSGGFPAAVLDFAQQNEEDLIVLDLDCDSSGPGGPRPSQAYEIVRQAKCPVLSVRSRAHGALQTTNERMKIRRPKNRPFTSG